MVLRIVALLTEHWCLCLPLKVGCYIVGLIEIIPWIVLIFFDVVIFTFMEPDPHEDNENMLQRQAVRFIYVCHVLRCTAFILFGVFIMLATKWQSWMLLKFCAVSEVFLFFAHLFILVLTPQNAIVGRFFLCWVSLSLWRLYSATVLFRYAVKLEEEEEEMEEEDECVPCKPRIQFLKPVKRAREKQPVETTEEREHKPVAKEEDQQPTTSGVQQEKQSYVGSIFKKFSGSPTKV